MLEQDDNFAGYSVWIPTKLKFVAISIHPAVSHDVSQFVLQFVFLLLGLLVVVWYALSMVYLKPTGGWTSDDSWCQRLRAFWRKRDRISCWCRLFLNQQPSQYTTFFGE